MASIFGREATRLKHFHHGGIVQTHTTSDLDDFVFLATQICGASAAILSFLDGNGQWSHASYGMTMDNRRRMISLGAPALSQTDVLVVADMSQDARFHIHPWVTRRPYIRFYAGIRLTTADNPCLGTLNVLDDAPRHLSQDQNQALLCLSRQIANRLQLRTAPQARRGTIEPTESEKQLYDALLKAENRARTMDLALEGASVGVWDWDLRTDLVNFDHRWCEMVGLDHKQTRMELKTWEQLVHPDDLKRTYEEIHAYIRGETAWYESIHRLQHANGTWVYILDRGRISAWDHDGKPIRFTGTHLDITAHERRKIELQEARRRLEEAEVAGRFGSWSLNLKTGECHWSRGLHLILDFDAEDDAPTFETFLSRLAPGDREKMAEIHRQMVTGAISVFETDYGVLMKSGEIRYVKANGTVHYEVGQAVSASGTVQDITSLKLMEMSLVQSREEAISATKTKSRFLATMSHEIRTPLNGIVGNTVLLMDTSLTAEQREMTEVIKSSSEDLLKLIDDILDFSKIEAGKLDIELQAFDLKGAVMDAVKVISGPIADKGLTLELHMNETTPDIIISDQFRLRQILLNLLSNAVKFTEAGTIRVEVSPVFVSESQTQIIVSVADTGIGLTAEQQQKLFKDFTQVDGSTTRKHGGTGLGLAICKQLCTLLGGSIEVQSELGKGSTFSFRIAAAVGDGLAPVHTHALPWREPLPLSGLEPIRILVAEDNEVNQAIALQFLRKFNLTADIVDNGLAAVEAVKRDFHELIFMDVHMPVMDGYDATKRIRAECPRDRQPYVVALTADAMKGDMNLCLDSGMNDFLKKPLNVSDLFNSISKFLALRKTELQTDGT
ncbi:MAG TPA: ATP-binding protein [Oligoflexus sp.]|uniref:ATP-binding protein n=1 Tax=Oligoflexus sp. TaxID=1971216 RepID=UPI002D807586|nr:ATP-binding protein [Oligoflexus sp.]HET9240872.1 ATP-binding protein [Oligoflexus sp.]